ncbi:hypothetical protein ACFX13_022396 [Malus domestica]
MTDAIDLSGDGGVLKKIVRHAKLDTAALTQDLPLVDVHSDISNIFSIWEYGYWVLCDLLSPSAQVGSQICSC